MTFKLKLSPPSTKGTWEFHYLLDNTTDERRALLGRLLAWYQQCVFDLSARYPNSTFELLETTRHKGKFDRITRVEPTDWRSLFDQMTAQFRIRSVKPMYSIGIHTPAGLDGGMVHTDFKVEPMFQQWRDINYPDDIST